MSIEITRGDSATYVAVVMQDGEIVPFSAGDTVYFTVKTSVSTAEKLIQKIITEFDDDGRAIINIEPEDTKNLAYKRYVYDVQHTSAEGKVTTIIKPSGFVVGGEVTYE